MSETLKSEGKLMIFRNLSEGFEIQLLYIYIYYLMHLLVLRCWRRAQITKLLSISHCLAYSSQEKEW